MKNLLFILFVLIGLTACKKEKSIERNLSSSKGTWTIKNFEASFESTGHPEQNFSEEFPNSGSIEFNKDGTGTMNFNNELNQFLEEISYGEIIGQEFTSYNTEESIFLIYGNNQGLGFDLEWEKNKMIFGRETIEKNVINDGNGNPMIDSSTLFIQFECVKK